MRMFYDVYSTRTRAEVLLLCADMLALAAAVVYSTGAVHADADSLDVLLLLLWTAFPRAFAKIATRFEHTGRILRVFGGSLAFVLLTSLLLLAGWDLLASVSPASTSSDPTVLIVVFAAWVTEFFVFHARTYRLLDFLLLSVVLFGLKDSRPSPEVWLPLFFLGFFVSTAVRHVLIDALGDRKYRQINLQNTRIVGILAMTVSCAILLPVHVVLQDVVGAPRTTPGASRGELSREASLRRSGNGPGPTPSSLASGGIPFVDDASGEGKASSDRVIGFSYRVELRDLALARFDSREILRIAAPNAEGWRPSRATLWKAVSLSRFDAETESWEEETRFRQRAWPKDGRLVLRKSEGSEPPAGVELRYRIVTPVFANLVSAYTAVEYRSPVFSGYRVNPLGDIYPSPRIDRDTEYFARLIPIPPGSLPPRLLPLARAAPAGGRAPDEVERYLQVPTRSQSGIDLAGLARKLRSPGRFADERAVILALQSHYQTEDFRYSNRALWRVGKGRLREFLERERVGDCTYFATSTALILRAAGVPTRLTVGFVGGAWDEKTQEVVVRNQEAHAWTEAFVAGYGWYPVDATRWVRADPSYQPPPEAIDSLEDLASAKSRLSLRGSRDPAGSASQSGSSSPTRLPPGGRGDLADYLQRDQSEELTEWERRAAGGGEATVDDEAVSWIEYGGFVDSGRRIPGADPDHPAWAEVEAYFAEDSGDLLDSSGSAAGHGGSLGRPPLAEHVRTLLRGGIPVLAALVMFVLLRTYLKPTRLKKRRGEEEGDEAIEDDVLAAAPGDSFSNAEIEGDDPRARILREYIRLQGILERTRSHRRAHQTPIEHARGVTAGRRALDRAFLDLHRILYHVVYAGGRPDDEHARLVARSCRRIARMLG